MTSGKMHFDGQSFMFLTYITTKWYCEKNNSE